MATNTNVNFQKCTFPTLCPKGTQKTINLNTSPKCWHDISNTKVFIQLTYISQIVGTIYEYCYTIVYFKICKLTNPAPEGRTETLQLTFILQVLARYIQYQLIYSTDIYFPKKIAAFIQNIYILSSSSSYQVLFKNITYVGSMGTEAVFVYFCICVFVYLQL